ncbi:MAG: glycosyltransferase [Chloroflexota bacterium]|jgi:1,2-diacylglycerol 3-alpha-glucosyltransferase
MHIGLISATYDPTVVNGAIRMVSLHQKYLEAAGHHVLIFTLGEEQEDDEQAGIIRSPGLRLGNYGYYISIGYSRRAQALLAQMDIVHSHHLLMSVEMAHRYARCPIVYTNHTRYDLYTGAYTPLPQPAADAIMRQLWPEFTDLADIVIAPSESIRQLMLEFGVRCPTVVIENGIELDPFLQPSRPYNRSDLGLSDEAYLLMYVGRLSSEKNLVVLLQQLAIAREIVPDLHVALLGKGPQEEELRLLVHQLGLQKNVHFIGVVPYEDVGNWLATADAFVTASTSEVHPLTVIEAMAAGLPTIGVASPGITDSIESGVNGYIVHTAEGGLAAAMVAMAADPNHSREMGQTARRASQRFDIQRTIDRTMELYDELMTSRPDLTREKEHGRRSRRTEKWGDLLDQLAHIIRPPEQTDSGLKRWFGINMPPPKEKGHE